MRRCHGSGRRVTPPCGGRPRREPPRTKSAERRHLMRSPSQGDQRQTFMLLEKMRTTLAEAQGKAGCVGLRHKDGHGPGIQGRPSSGRAEASTVRVAMAAPSTLSLPGQAAHLKTGWVKIFSLDLLYRLMYLAAVSDIPLSVATDMLEECGLDYLPNTACLQQQQQR
ncbi:uncharacterized protein LOC126996028 [Eriocheir sinensis]|uniref:uncharacterized protein LOC126996028 n=1 Tax=Eriocheir sinensis TaxID=95602 RepID=UPI0021CA09BE|nr:uncharacterized protein LOC126996028 [Eriocheir sinensis]XP_050711991.1 uncharacterized protein LOC126996028 [Eriocheir sinensis]